jgi:hypothetical protein
LLSPPPRPGPLDEPLRRELPAQVTGGELLEYPPERFHGGTLAVRGSPRERLQSAADGVQSCHATCHGPGGPIRNPLVFLGRATEDSNL